MTGPSGEPGAANGEPGAASGEPGAASGEPASRRARGDATPPADRGPGARRPGHPGSATRVADVHPAGLVAQAAALAAGECTATELVEAAVGRALASQRGLNAFRVVRADEARREAQDADRRLRAGERAPLLGMPVVIKDDTDLAGHPTAFGCAGDFPDAAVDAEVVRRLRAAGAIVIGKTNTPELGQWPFTEGSAFGATRNPWDPRFTPGGSSGGTAAAVSAGIVAGGIGSDGAGSVRIPAAWCHLVGIKPQRGRVSNWPESDAFYGLTTHGVLARTVEDAATLLDAVAGPHPADRHRAGPLAEPLAAAARRDPGRLRIGLSTRPPFSLLPTRLHDEVADAVDRVAGVLRALGHHVEPIEPAYGLIGTSFLPRSHRGLNDWAGRVPDPDALDPRTRQNCRSGGRIPRAALRFALRSERWWARRVGALFSRVDLVLAPTTASPPLPVGAADGRGGLATDRLVVGACPYAWPWNVLGWPALNVPAGLTAAGLPVGAQLLGPADSEPVLVSLAAQLQAVEHWDVRRPPGWLGPGGPAGRAGGGRDGAGHAGTDQADRP